MNTPQQIARDIEKLTTIKVCEIYEADDPTVEDDSITIMDGGHLYNIQICAMEYGLLSFNRTESDGSVWHGETYKTVKSLVRSEFPESLR